VSLIRNTNTFHVSTFDFQSKRNICAFEVFPAIGTLVVVDRYNDVRLFDIWKATCYQIANYSYIVKNLSQPIKILKISKT
jgi:hypothetical protein